tara:strand:- start:374 stop:508 length:135 start_codon:yes stop_codon:yes gene_type:complete
MSTKGNENKNLPAYTITIAKNAAKIIVKDIITFEIFLLDVLANQ